ncbi:MAG: HPF/RaiA family ribosome-associated protein, partial [Syntrophomonadaceae bacterium]|nr:HPF/RaiA family ribosome-associated protein [Syntrophomonadaceae bacterium]
MKVDIRGKNIELTEALKEYTTKRISKLERFFEDANIANVALSV